MSGSGRGATLSHRGLESPLPTQGQRRKPALVAFQLGLLDASEDRGDVPVVVDVLLSHAALLGEGGGAQLGLVEAAGDGLRKVQPMSAACPRERAIVCRVRRTWQAPNWMPPGRGPATSGACTLQRAVALHDLPDGDSKSNVLEGALECMEALARWRQQPPTIEEADMVMGRILELDATVRLRRASPPLDLRRGRERASTHTGTTRPRSAR
jgi:hypothetical protein